VSPPSQTAGRDGLQSDAFVVLSARASAYALTHGRPDRFRRATISVEGVSVVRWRLAPLPIDGGPGARMADRTE